MHRSPLDVHLIIDKRSAFTSYNTDCTLMISTPSFVLNFRPTWSLFRKPLFLVLASACLMMQGCVSVNLGPKGPSKSKNVAFITPGLPYRQIKGSPADGAWQNPENGNSISFLSTCNEESDPSLEAATDEMISAFGETKQLSQKKFEFDGRDALDTQAEARVEGVPTKIRALVFKKNACLYTLSLIGISKSFSKGEKPFDDFVKGFQAP